MQKQQVSVRQCAAAPVQAELETLLVQKQGHQRRQPRGIEEENPRSRAAV